MHVRNKKNVPDAKMTAHFFFQFNFFVEGMILSQRNKIQYNEVAYL